MCRILSVLLLVVLFTNNAAISQSKNTVTIIADLSGFTSPLPNSSDPAWAGNDTLVSLTVGSKVPERMGAEYLVFPNRLEGDSLSPRDDAARSSQRKIWRSKAAIAGNIYKWQFKLNRPCLISNPSLLGSDCIVLPGDSIFISYQKNKPVVSGRGAVKFQLFSKIENSAEELFAVLDEKKWPRDLADFLRYNRLLNEQTSKALAILDSGKSKINQYEYEWIKARFLSEIEYYRWLYFYMTPNPAVKKTQKFSYTSQDLVRVWDSIMYQPESAWSRSAAILNMPGIGSRGTMESFIVTELHKDLGFLDVDSINNQQVFKKMAYERIKSRFSGLFRERLLCYFINEEFIQELGSFHPTSQYVLNDYYRSPGFPAYKEWVRSMEIEYAYLSKGNTNGGAPLFNLFNQEGNSYTKKNTEGKFTIVNFWYTGCEPCKVGATKLTQVQQRFRNDTNVIFVNVSVDKDKALWEESIREGKFVSNGGVQLWTGGQGKEHDVLKDFYVTGFPTIRMYDNNGRIVIDEAKPYATDFSQEELITAISGKILMSFRDGPYVLYENGKAKAWQVKDNKATVQTSPTKFTSATDQDGKLLQFSLQKKIKVPASVHPAASKIIVLSDIEGNFTPFKNLLKSNKVMDENFNWTFGKGHLVIAGDMFDRGNQVTECLWLIYSLEEKAKAVGGMVHFILGNHEIMNLQGNHNYVEDKYMKSAELIGKTLTELYNENSELGRWLRSKNIVEKIGDILFMHGGVSTDLNNSGLSIEQINQLARPNYDTYKRDYGNEKVNTVMSSSVGPFWFRGYYENKISEKVVDSTLRRYDINRIITGHTIVADTISIHYNGKVINTDTKHASGKSEALLIEGDKFYRVNDEGRRVLLLYDNKMKTFAPKSR